MDFVDKDIENVVAVKPPSIESTPFKLVEEVKDLKELAAKLRNVNEFVVRKLLYGSPFVFDAPLGLEWGVLPFWYHGMGLCLFICMLCLHDFDFG